MRELLYDARRFILKFRYIAGVAPLQLYISGLTFAPTLSILKQLFFKEKPDWTSTPKSIEDNWDAQLQTLEGHKENLRSIAFSSNGFLLASGADDKTVKIWEIATGTLRQTFTGYKDSVISVAFSSDTQTLASISKDGRIRFWDVATGVLQRSIQHKDNYILEAAFSLDISLLATRGLNKTWEFRSMSWPNLFFCFCVRLFLQMGCYWLVPQCVVYSFAILSQVLNDKQWRTSQ
jgi:WD40 repeat protein